LSSGDYNLIGKTNGSTGTWKSHDLTGSIASPTNAMLGLLQNNGGPTPALALLAGSPAIDKGDSNHSGAPHQDQRGFTRLVDLPLYPDASSTAADIGAYEFQLPESYRDIGFHAFDGTRANKIAAQRPAVSALQTRPIAAVVLRRVPDARAARPTRAQRRLCRLINGPGALHFRCKNACCDYRHTG
jgi:hypothetical protein